MYHLTNDDGKAYDVSWLKSNMDLTRLVFHHFLDNTEYDAFSLVDAYMQTSEVRSKMDICNIPAMYKGDKQVYNSIDKSVCFPCTGKNDTLSLDIFYWMADIYPMFQWIFAIPSKDINAKVPARELYHIFYPLHEASLKIACEKIHEAYWEKGKKSQFELFIKAS